MFGFHLKYLIIFLAKSKKSMYSDVDSNIPYTPGLYAYPFLDWKEVFIFEMNSADSISLVQSSSTGGQSEGLFHWD
jgi:hypothetical protein